MFSNTSVIDPPSHSTAQWLRTQTRVGVWALTSCVIMGKLLNIPPAPPRLLNWSGTTHIIDGCATVNQLKSIQLNTKTGEFYGM